MFVVGHHDRHCYNTHKGILPANIKSMLSTKTALDTLMLIN